MDRHALNTSVRAADSFVTTVVAAVTADTGSQGASYLANALYTLVNLVGDRVYPQLRRCLDDAAGTRAAKDGCAYPDGEGPGVCSLTAMERAHVAELLIKWVCRGPMWPLRVWVITAHGFAGMR